MRGDGLGFDDVGVGGWDAAGLAVGGGGLGVAAGLGVVLWAGVIAVLRLQRLVCLGRLGVMRWCAGELRVAVASGPGVGVDPVGDPARD